MASQEFLASFGVEIDEAGVTRLQTVLAENRKLAEEVSASFDAASESIRTFARELGMLPNGSGNGAVTEGLSGLGGLSLGLDLTQAKKDMDAFIAQAKKPIPLTGNGAGIVAAGRSAYNQVKSLFSTPIFIQANVRTVSGGAGDGSGGRQQASVGGRFSKTTDVQVAEDGDPEYIIPVKKEDRAVPLLRQLLGELSPAARESLTSGAADLPSGGISAGNAGIGNITQDNRTVSAPVNINVNASSANVAEVGQKLYDTAERYLLRTLQGAFSCDRR